jgi:Alkylmercury lyase
MNGKITSAPDPDRIDTKLRLFVYRHLIRSGRAPLVAEMAKGLSWPKSQVESSLDRLSASHAFMRQENGELWRAAPFSAIPTAFPVRVGKRSWWANCIWDALGIPAMLQEDATIDASCGCCNLSIELRVKRSRLTGDPGVIHIAVPARDWYKDIVFT